MFLSHTCVAVRLKITTYLRMCQTSSKTRNILVPKWLLLLPLTGQVQFDSTTIPGQTNLKYLHSWYQQHVLPPTSPFNTYKDNVQLYSSLALPIVFFLQKDLEKKKVGVSLLITKQVGLKQSIPEELLTQLLCTKMSL